MEFTTNNTSSSNIELIKSINNIAQNANETNNNYFNGVTIVGSLNNNFDNSDNINTSLINFNVIGCWNSLCKIISFGSQLDLQGQPYIASLMKQFEAIHKPQFTLLLGDNRYTTKVNGIKDSELNYEDRMRLYVDDLNKGLDCFKKNINHHYIALLGNQDISTIDLLKYEMSLTKINDINQIISNWIMPSTYYCTQIQTTNEKGVNIFMLDTNMLTNTQYPTLSKEQKREKEIDQLNWLDNELSQKSSDINIICGHHPIFAVGHKSKKTIIVEMSLMPLYKILLKYNIKFYLCADEHNCQYLYDSVNDVHHLIVGGSPYSGGDIVYSNKINANVINQQFNSSGVSIINSIPELKLPIKITAYMLISAPAYVNFSINKNSIKFSLITLNNVQNNDTTKCSNSNPIETIGQIIYEKMIPMYSNVVYIQDCDKYSHIINQTAIVEPREFNLPLIGGTKRFKLIKYFK
jgi:hypothetical protein